MAENMNNRNIEEEEAIARAKWRKAHGLPPMGEEFVKNNMSRLINETAGNTTNQFKGKEI